MSDSQHLTGGASRERAADALARFDEAFVEPEAAPTEPAPPPSFAERALGPPPSPLDRIDHLFHQTPRRIWWGVAALIALIAAGIVWTAVADRVVTADSQGVVVPPEGLFTVRHAQPGQIGEVRVTVGDAVEQGAPLANLTVAGSPDPEPITSPIDGTVVVVGVRPGEVVTPGAATFVVAPTGSDAVAIGLYAAGAVSAIASGQEASVAVNGIPDDQYGRIEGHVRSVGETPVPASRLIQLTGDATLASSLTQQGPLYEVVVELAAARTPSGYAWTRGEGPPQPVPIGALAVVSVVLERQTLLETAFD